MDKKIKNMSLMNKSHKNYVLFHEIILPSIFKVNLFKNFMKNGYLFYVKLYYINRSRA